MVRIIVCSVIFVVFLFLGVLFLNISTDQHSNIWASIYETLGILFICIAILVLVFLLAVA